MNNRTEIKICGLTSTEDAAEALRLGADYLGFVLYEKSPRGITFDSLKSIAAELPDTARLIAVTVNESAETVERYYKEANLFAVQLHGDENYRDFNLPGINLWRAIKADGTLIEPCPSDWKASRYVVDAAAPGMYGGSGSLADWDKAAMIAERYSTMLAGGITPENVRLAIEKVKPTGVDTASGVEAEPGRKDFNKMAAFFAAVRGTD